MATIVNPSNSPNNPSRDYRAMQGYWVKVTDLFLGADAVRAKKETYLPRFESESTEQYNQRVKFARYTNLYSDILNTLVSKPFSEEIKVINPSDGLKPLIEDIDGQGNNLHAFAKDYFKNAVNLGLDWIFVDYTRTAPTVLDASGRARRKSVAEERAEGARPYWVRVSALDMIAVYSVKFQGVETFTHCRMMESYTERDGYDERDVVQVRELDREILRDDNGNIVGLGPVTWKIHRQNDRVWEVVDEGTLPIPVIPIIPLVIGDRIGSGWQIIGEMKDVADLQIDLYQQEAALQNARTLTAFPMLAADGIDPPTDGKGNPIPVPVGPRAVLFGGRNVEGKSGTWKFLEISATSLKFLAEEIENTKKDLRELGRQPLTAQTGNLTSITTAFAAQKGNTAVQAWALALKDALEQAFVITDLWRRTGEEPSVEVFTDFEIGLGEDDGFDKILEMRTNRDLSRKTTWKEAQRRGILADSFDEDIEEKTILEEGDERTPEDDVLEALGAIVQQGNRPQVDPEPDPLPAAAE